MYVQVAAQREVLSEQSERMKDFEASTRQLEERCAELKEAAAQHDERAKAAAAEALKANRAIEKLSVRGGSQEMFPNTDLKPEVTLTCPGSFSSSISAVAAGSESEPPSCAEQPS